MGCMKYLMPTSETARPPQDSIIMHHFNFKQHLTKITWAVLFSVCQDFHSAQEAENFFTLSSVLVLCSQGPQPTKNYPLLKTLVCRLTNQSQTGNLCC